MLRIVRNFRHQAVLVALLACVSVSAVAQSPAEDPKGRIEFLEGALASYQRQLSQLTERLAVAESTVQTLQRQLSEAKSPPKDEKKK